jgi:5-oxoprolinase (ATP-hydrolysing)
MLKFRNLGGKNTAAMKPGERIIICTPGGGGYGNFNETDEKKHKGQRKMHARDQWRGTGSVWNYQAVQESA